MATVEGIKLTFFWGASWYSCFAALNMMVHNYAWSSFMFPKDLLCGELVQGNCPRGRPQLWYKDICKWDLKVLGMDRWETLTSERAAWRQALQHGLFQFEETLVQQAQAKRKSQKQQNQGAGQGTDCIQCGRDCHSWIGLLSHTGRCSKTSI